MQAPMTDELFEIVQENAAGIFLLSCRIPWSIKFNLYIFNLRGEKIWENTGLQFERTDEMSIDLSSLHGGIYVMIIQSGRNTWVRKLVRD